MRRRKIESISIGFENCEDITISQSAIKRFVCKEITSTAYFDPFSGTVDTLQCCGELFLELDKEADCRYNSFGQTSEYTVFRRILFDDIVSITVNYSDGLCELIYVPFEGDGINLCQSSLLRDTGQMLICIKQNGDSLAEVVKEIHAE